MANDDCKQWKWLPVCGFEGVYEVSARGDVRRTRGIDAGGRRCSEKVLRASVSRRSRRRHICLKYGNKVRYANIATLVCEAFCGPRPEGAEVCHADGTRDNDCFTNLRWGSHADNEADKIRHGTLPTGKRNGKYTKPEATPRGERHGMAKLTREQVALARQLMDAGTVNAYVMSKLLNVTYAHTKGIRSRKTWRHLDELQ